MAQTGRHASAAVTITWHRMTGEDRRMAILAVRT